jgi:hypothetical protein
MQVTFTGRRETNENSLDLVYKSLQEMIETKEITSANIGMAQGYDLLVARYLQCIGIRTHLFIPFFGHLNYIPPEHRSLYMQVLAGSTSRTTLPGKHSKKVYLDRNLYMLGECPHVVAIWDGEKTGGTWHTISNAKTVSYIDLNTGHITYDYK